MIFVCVGSRQYQFNRLFQTLDELVKQGFIKDKIVAQIGNSEYKPKNYSYKKFIWPEEFEENIYSSTIVISHGGSGSIVKALKAGKQVIAVPRLAKYGEHINDHQVQTIRAFAMNKYVLAAYEMEDLCGALQAYADGTADIVQYVNFNPNAIIDRIDTFIQNTFR